MPETFQFLLESLASFFALEPKPVLFLKELSFSPLLLGQIIVKSIPRVGVFSPIASTVPIIYFGLVHGVALVHDISRVLDGMSL
jgi:hypothetical protein